MAPIELWPYIVMALCRYGRRLVLEKSHTYMVMAYIKKKAGHTGTVTIAESAAPCVNAVVAWHANALVTSAFFF